MTCQIFLDNYPYKFRAKFDLDVSDNLSNGIDELMGLHETVYRSRFFMFDG